MPRVRAGYKRGNHTLSKHEFYTVLHFALQYGEWKDRKDSIVGIQATASDGMPHASGVGNPTEKQAMAAEHYIENMRMVESIAHEVGGSMYRWLLKGVTTEGCTYNYLRNIMNIPCGKDMYYNMRHEFYWKLSQKLNQAIRGQ